MRSRAASSGGGVASQHGQPQAVGLLGHQRQFDGLTTTLEGVGYVAGCLDQRLTAGTDCLR